MSTFFVIPAQAGIPFVFFNLIHTPEQPDKNLLFFPD
jgi:hypothetical protein